MKLGLLASNELQELVKGLANKPLPAKTAFKLKTSIKKIQEALISYNESVRSCQEKHGKRNKKNELDIDANGNIQFTQENMRLFMAEISELNAVEVEIPTIGIEEFGDIDFTAEQLSWLDGLIV